MEKLQDYFKQIRISIFQRDGGISILQVQDSDSGIQAAKELLYKICDKKTVLFLSGGTTPKPLYEQLAKEEKLQAGALAMVDERFGKPMHERSNERMIADTGLLRYAQYTCIPVNRILHLDLSREQTARAYDEKVRFFLFNMPKSVGILGIGEDGHTAGLPAVSVKFKVQSAKLFQSSEFVTEYNDTSGKYGERARPLTPKRPPANDWRCRAGSYGERVTMTFKGLAMLDMLIVLVFGSEKQKAIEQMFVSGSLEDIPARFYTEKEIARKTLLITDLKV